jgi:hypothetical protein
MLTWDAESQSASEFLGSDTLQGFEPREDDCEMFYEVVEITGETKDTYKVCWKGNDPNTSKPWPQSWVPKEDCTDNLVQIWNGTSWGESSVLLILTFLQQRK